MYSQNGRKNYHQYQVYALQQKHSEEDKRRLINLLKSPLEMRREKDRRLLLKDFNAIAGMRRYELE